MSVITKVPQRNLWRDICADFASRRPPFPVVTDTGPELVNYDAAIVTPVFYGYMHSKVNVDADVTAEFDPAKSHPACLGYVLVSQPLQTRETPAQPLPNKKTCSSEQYLEKYVFPVLMTAMEEMMKNAKKEKCFERRRSKFNALDFLSEYLYKNNKSKADARAQVSLMEIPFAKEWLSGHPRPPLPLSLVWTEEEAAIIIQSFWRGYLVRKIPEIQEMRQWQREWKQEHANVREKVDDFWEDIESAHGGKDNMTVKAMVLRSDRH